MDHDITELLRDWAFDPDDQFRLVHAGDGRKVLQVRQPLGIEQYELSGRPDGKRPFGRESVLEEIQDRLDKSRADDGDDGSFSIDHEDFLRLQNEGVLYYYRYLILFQMGDFTRTVADTEHNLHLCDMVDKYGEPDDKKEILQYRPYILRMFAISRAMLVLANDDRDSAVDIVEAAIREIQSMREVDTPTFQFERIRSIQYLRTALRQIRTKTIATGDKLQRELDRAVEVEDYEEAARLRDQLAELESNSDTSG